MRSDFLDAHERHWTDAETLLKSLRLANADHLYGMAAECGLKRLMVAFGMPVDQDGTPVERKKDWKHVNQIWARYEAYRSAATHPKAPAYLLPTHNPFDNWQVEQRYASQSEFTDADVRAHRDGTMMVRRLINQAKEDGLL